MYDCTDEKLKLEYARVYILPQKYEMTPDEIHRIAQVAHSIGVRKIRLSGGEPLIRDDIKEIVSKISSIGFKDVSITTNGT